MQPLQNYKTYSRKNRALEKRQKRAENEKLFETEGDYVESAEQLRVRLHSHLLTGRITNRPLQTFAQELQKKLYNQSKPSDFSSALNIDSKTFRKAQKKTSRVI